MKGIRGTPAGAAAGVMTPGLLVAFLLLAGCVTHEVVGRQERVPAADDEIMPGESALVEDRLHWRWRGPATGRPAVATRSDPLPVDLAITSWTYRPDGDLRRAEVLIESPRPWWQRFPADVVTDLLLPRTFYARAEVTVTPIPVVPRTPAQLDGEASARGFARPTSPSGPVPETRAP